MKWKVFGLWENGERCDTVGLGYPETGDEAEILATAVEAVRSATHEDVLCEITGANSCEGYVSFPTQGDPTLYREVQFVIAVFGDRRVGFVLKDQTDRLYMFEPIQGRFEKVDFELRHESDWGNGVPANHPLVSHEPATGDACP